MTYSFVLAAAAFLPSLLALFEIEEALIWRLSAVLFGLPMLSLQVSYPRRRRRVIGQGPPPPIFAIFVVFGSIVTLAMLVYMLSGLRFGAAVYITALTINFFTVVFAFVTALEVVMRQPIEAKETSD